MNYATADDLSLRMQAGFQQWSQHMPGTVAVDTETSGLEYNDEAFCATVAWVHNNEVYSHYIELNPEGVHLLRNILTVTPELVMHNAGFDMQKLNAGGITAPLPDWKLKELEEWKGLHDTQALAHLLDEHQSLGLKALARTVLGEDTPDEAAIKEWFKEKKIKKADQDYSMLPRDILIPYALMDVNFTIRLFNKLLPQVLHDPDLEAMYRIEQELTFVLYEMRQAGMAVDRPYLEKTSREYAKRGLQLELDLREMTGNDEFNPNSPKQVKEALHAKGIFVGSTGKDALKEIEKPLPQGILEIRSVRKIHGTYLIPLLEMARAGGGVMHGWWRQHTAVTGRMSSGGVQS